MKRTGTVFLLFAFLAMAVDAPSVLFVQPNHFPAPTYNFEANKLTAAKIELGRRLFYDELLSRDNSTSCASCHSPYSAFAHTDHELSHGIEDRIGFRNAPPLFNLAWATSFHRDGAIHHLDVQPLAPISHPDEMGSSIEAVAQRLNASEHYPSRFYNAFADSVATGEHILLAIAQFQLTLVSAGSKYDRVVSQTDTFSNQEQSGYELFKKHCSSCHSEPLFTTNGFANNGLPLDTSLNDFGRMGITNNPQDSLNFKVASLRNLSFTHPYMHDGRFKTLSQVLQHYTERETDPLDISANQQRDIIAFLLTLDDRDFIFNPKHGFPRD